MSDNLTNKDLLNIIVKQQQEMARKQLDFAAEVSSFINKQTLINEEQVKLNSKFANYLENDISTNQIGIVQRSIENTRRLDELEKKNDISAGKLTVLMSVSAVIGSIVWKVVDFVNR